MSNIRTINYCKICKKRIVAKVWKIHVMGRKHVHYTPSAIRVTGAFNTDNVDQVHDYFSQFGNFGSKTVLNDNGKVTVEYSYLDRRTHSFIIYKEHRLFNQPVNITWDEVTTPLPAPHIQNLPAKDSRRNNVRTLSNDRNQKDDGFVTKTPPGKKGADSETTKLTIIAAINQGQTFEEQMQILQNKLQPDKTELEQKKKLIHNDLTTALAPMFALNRICFFGSSITGLEVQGSDLDIYIANVREGPKPEVQTLKSIRHLIYKCRKFCDFLLISGAKTPIIKCIHTKTQICCDLNIKNKLSVCNSELIKYYLSLDDKLRPLMIMIKFWAERYDLKKVNFFSSYALYMMTIFYLQQEPFKLPAVKELQSDCIPDFVDGWNCAFKPLEFNSESLKSTPIEELVTGFFEYYGNFDYIYDVISPYYGTIIKKTSFLKPVDLPEGCPEYLNLKPLLAETSGICIQDPFELSRNIAAAVPLQCVGKLTAMCNISYEIMQTESKDSLYQTLTYRNITDYQFHLQKPDDLDETEWKTKTKNLIETILKDVLSMKVVSASTVYTCIGEYNIWDNRINIFKNLLTQLPADTSDLNREIAATKCIIKYIPQTLTTNMTVNIAFKAKPTRCEIYMKPMNKKCKNFLHVCHYFRIKLSKFLEKPLGEDERVATPVPLDLDDKSAGIPSPSEMTQQRDKISEENNIRSSSSPGKQVETGTAAEQQQQQVDENVVDEEEEEAEDVPADFFDDFSNQDFMDGLDIVDAWEGESKVMDSDHSEKRPHSPIRFIKSKSSEKRSKRRTRSRSLTRPYKRSNSKRSRSREKIRISERRDPEKTRRDISKDKIKVAKDREQKIVNDKLKIVETGLVPPGTEMDVDLNAIIKEKRRSSPEKSRERDRRYLRRSSGSREQQPPRKRYSPSPRRVREREREPVHRPRRRTSSMDSNISDRELWMRQSRKRTRSRSRDSPRRTKTKKYEEAKKKKTFLEEIRDKLNETRTPTPQAPPVYSMTGYNNAATHQMPAPAPAPVPAPNQYFQQGPANPVQYDQSFFIGDAYRPQSVLMSPQQSIGFGMMGNAIPAMHMSEVPQIPSVPVPSPVQAPVKVTSVLSDPQLNSPKINVLSNAVVKNKVEEKRERNNTEDIDKLFADKKISLSDFLTITAKCEAQSSPELLQKKIKVISRCQDAIKAMSDDRKFTTGRLSVNPSMESKYKNEVKYQSPLRKIPIVRFQFTSPAKVTEDTDVFTLALDKVLQKIGVLKETADFDESSESITKLSNSAFADEETAALTLKASLLGMKKAETKSECEECKKRKSKTFADVGSQSVDNKETVEIGIQVTEEDLNPSKRLMKNDSMAYLTPAQLLGKDKEKEKETEAAPTPEKPAEKNETSPFRKERPKPPMRGRGRGRGTFQKNVRDRSFNNYEYDEEFTYDFYDNGRQIFDESRDNFGRRYGEPPANNRFPRQQYYEEEERPRVQQFEEEDRSFMDFSQPFRGGGRGRFGPRY